MIALEYLKQSGFFKEISLKTGEILFHEGEKNNFLYIVYDGELSIQKSISSQADNFRTLSLLGVGNIIGEGALSQNIAKEVQVSAARNSILLAIDAQKDFPKFLEKSPQKAYNLLLHIIDLSNTRLLRANREVTANYEISCAIAKIGQIDIQAIISLLHIFQGIVQADEILYFEKNTALEEYYKLKYTSREEAKIQNTILHFEKNVFSLEKIKKENIAFSGYIRFIPLLLGEKNHGFLLIGREKKDFNENEEKLLQNIASSFVGVIHQKEIQDEQKNKSYIKEVKHIF